MSFVVPPMTQKLITLLLGVSATFVSTIASLPLLYKSCNQNKSLDQLSKKTLLIGILAHGLWFAYAYLIDDMPLTVCSGITFIIEVTLLVLKTKRSIFTSTTKWTFPSYKNKESQTDLSFVSDKQLHI